MARASVLSVSRVYRRVPTSTPQSTRPGGSASLNHEQASFSLAVPGSLVGGRAFLFFHCK